jgi:putative transposase
MDLQMLLPKHDFSRCVGGARWLQLVIRLQAIQVERKLKVGDVQEGLTELFCRRDVPESIRSDNGSEFTAKMIRTWLNKQGTRTFLFLEPGSPWENGYIETFNGKLLNELLNLEIFYTLQEAKRRIEHWRRDYNRVRLHRALGYKTPCSRSDTHARHDRDSVPEFVPNTNIKSRTKNRGRSLQRCRPPTNR